MKKAFIIIALLSYLTAHSEQTLGLFYNTPKSYDGYTLFAPNNSKTTYLINNCGEKVHSWESTHLAGVACYLLENGILLRAGKVENKVFVGGGTGGIIEMIDWDGKVIWDFTLSDSMQSLHHDIEYLPNGNILAIVWDSYSKDQSLEVGRVDPPEMLWSEKIIEIEPNLETGESKIVWEWNVWDHLVQDQNPDALNFGNIENPDLIDINYTLKDPSRKDWLHFNSVSYNAKLDQIILSNHSFGELWVIDHSTTTAEARTNNGGNSGKGGDLLYRWGNQNAYSVVKDHQQMLFYQHDPHWIADSLVDGGKIMVFNNRYKSGNLNNSSAVVIIVPPVDENNNYIKVNNAYGPEDFFWIYEDTPVTDFNALNLSGAQRLANGNTLICNGFAGTLFEIDADKNKVWKYIVPVGGDNIIGTQGMFLPGNQTFRSYRFSADYPALQGRDLTPQGYIETGSEFTCQLFDGTTNSVGFVDNTDIEVKLIDRTLNIDSKNTIDNVEIYNLSGNRITSINNKNNHYSITTNEYAAGVYLVRLTTDNQEAVVFKFLVD